MSTAVGTGHFVSWEGGCLLIGNAHEITPLHSHYAIQIGFCSTPGIRFRPSARDEWSEYDGVVIASRQPHAMDATRVPPSAVLFIEPETREGRAIAERFSHGGIVALPSELLADAPALFEAWRDQGTATAIREAAQRVVRGLTGGIDPSVVSDERILHAIDYIKRNLGQSITLDDVAAQAFLSPSRFRHLFVEQTGMALRPYILWRRFLHVWELIMDGESLSAAAHGAGFADAAHLTRTCRRAFGFPPSLLRLSDLQE